MGLVRLQQRFSGFDYWSHEPEPIDTDDDFFLAERQQGTLCLIGEVHNHSSTVFQPKLACTATREPSSSTPLRRPAVEVGEIAKLVGVAGCRQAAKISFSARDADGGVPTTFCASGPDRIAERAVRQTRAANAATD